jgi:ferredoxin
LRESWIFHGREGDGTFRTAAYFKLSSEGRIHLNYDLLVVGAGPSALAFLHGLTRQDGRTILVLAASGKEQGSPVNLLDVPRSPKLRQPRVDASLRAWLSSLPQICVPNERFAPVGIHGFGGSAQYWGGAVGRFDRSALIRNSFDPTSFEEAYQALTRFVPVSSFSAENARVSEPADVYLRRSNRIAGLDGIHCDARMEVGPATVAIHTSGARACVGCNRCLSGCESNSIWAPTRKDFMSLGHNVAVETGFVSEIRPESDGFAVRFRTGEEVRSCKARQVVLAAGAIMNFNLLAPLSQTKSPRAPLLNCPSYAFAFLAKPTETGSMFGMAQSAFRMKGEDGEVLSVGCLYDGLSLSSYAEPVFFGSRQLDSVAQRAARWLIFGAGYLDSDNSEVELRRVEGKLIVDARSRPSRKPRGMQIKALLRRFGSEAHKPLVVFQSGQLGIDVHYGGGIPDDLGVEPGGSGSLRRHPGITVVGGSQFSYLPPDYPTFSLMAASFLCGQQYGRGRA